MACAREFTAQLGVTLDEPCYTAWWRRHLLAGSGAMFLIDCEGTVAGGIGGTLNQIPLTGEVSAVESFWYVSEAHRGGLGGLRLHAAFEAWARAQGAADVNMIFMEKSMPGRVRNYYYRQGYELLETVHQKSFRPRPAQGQALPAWRVDGSHDGLPERQKLEVKFV